MWELLQLAQIDGIDEIDKTVEISWADEIDGIEGAVVIWLAELGAWKL